MYIFANVNNNVVIKLKNVTFINNSASSSITGHYDGDAIYCYTRSNSTNFTMISSFVYNSIVIRSNAFHTSVVIDKSLWGYVKGRFGLTLETYSNLSVSFSNMTFIGTQVNMMVRSNPMDCILKFDGCKSSDNSSLKIYGQSSNGFQCYITNYQFFDNNIDGAIIDIQNIKRIYPDT